MVKFLIALVLLLVPFESGSVTAATGKAASGIAVYYVQGAFARVAQNRGMKLRTDVAGYAAVPDCKWIGKILTAKLNGGPLEKYQVLDCAQPYDYANLKRRGVVIEVDYASAKRRGFVSKGHAPATVYYP